MSYSVHDVLVVHRVLNRLIVQARTARDPQDDHYDLPASGSMASHTCLLRTYILSVAHSECSGGRQVRVRCQRRRIDLDKDGSICVIDSSASTPIMNVGLNGFWMFGMERLVSISRAYVTEVQDEFVHILMLPAAPSLRSMAEGSCCAVHSSKSVPSDMLRSSSGQYS